MDITGEHTIPADRQTVWEALNDPDVLRECMPGCEALDKVSDTEFNARVKAKIGPVKASFNTRIELQDLNPPQSYTISGEGQGGAAGFAKGSADVNLEDNGEETVLRYSARIQSGGRLAQVGSRLLAGTTRKLANEFFSAFAARMSPDAAGGKEQG